MSSLAELLAKHKAKDAVVDTPVIDEQVKKDTIKEKQVITADDVGKIDAESIIGNINKTLLSFTEKEQELIEEQVTPEEFNNPEQKAAVTEGEQAFKQALGRLHKIINEGLDNEIASNSIRQVMTMLQQSPAYQELVLPSDIGAMVALLERITETKRAVATKRKRTPKKEIDKKAAAEVDDILSAAGFIV